MTKTTLKKLINLKVNSIVKNKYKLGAGAYFKVYDMGDFVIKIPLSSNNAIIKNKYKRFYICSVFLYMFNRLNNKIKNIIPEVHMGKDGFLIQQKVGGLTYDDLSVKKLKKVDKKIFQLQEQVNDILLGVGEADANICNFRFNEQGIITSWFDPFIIYIDTDIDYMFN